MLFPAALGAQSTPLEPVKTSITVVEKVSAETPASITVLESEDVRRALGVNLDDRLRDMPGFSLFRRSSSVAAHPTTQGVSLRGVAPTGASRTLVLWDGVPVNDPFGGWVYWTRFPPWELERVEVSRGASTSVFGDRAMGGAIHIFSREPAPMRAQGGYEGGSHNSHELSAGFSHLAPRWAVSGGARAFTTDGYFIVPEKHRGTIDRKAGVRFVSAGSRFDLFRTEDRLFFKLDILAEERRNGTELQRNSTGLGTAAAHYFRERDPDSFSVLAYHSRQAFRSSFSAIAADRQSERLTLLQRVPAEAVGANFLWKRRAGRWQSLLGADLQRVEGFSNETLFPAGSRVGGGDLLQHGFFAQTDVQAGSTRLFLGARQHFTGQDRRFFSPSAGVVAGTGRLRARGSVYRSFRAPTLNELYREFRVGNVVTQANDALRPERLTGAEAGVDLVHERTRGGITFYHQSLRDLITNVTLSSTPTLIVRQRQNQARALARGIEFNARRRWRNWDGEAAYLFVDPRFSTGERIPQVSRHQGSAQLTYFNGGTMASVGLRSYAFQFEDELNRFILPGFSSVQTIVRQRLTANLSATLTFENLLDREYFVGLTPTPVTGPPRLWRAGVRWEGRIR